jgi:hypothetical protein
MIKRINAYLDAHTLSFDIDRTEDLLDDLVDLSNEIAVSGPPPQPYQPFEFHLNAPPPQAAAGPPGGPPLVPPSLLTPLSYQLVELHLNTTPPPTTRRPSGRPADRATGGGARTGRNVSGPPGPAVARAVGAGASTAAPPPCPRVTTPAVVAAQPFLPMSDAQRWVANMKYGQGVPQAS